MERIGAQVTSYGDGMAARVAALARIELAPLALGPKEGLALLNEAAVATVRSQLREAMRPSAPWVLCS